MLTPGQRRNKLKSRISLLSCKLAIVRDHETYELGIAELEREIARLQAIATQRRLSLIDYTAHYGLHLSQRRFCRRLRELIKEHPDADIKVLEHIVSEEQGFVMRFDAINGWYND